MVPLSLFIIWYGTCSCLIYMTLLPSVSFKVCSWWVTTLSHYIVKTYSWWIYNAPFSTLHHSDIFHSLYTPHISMNIIIPLMHLTRPVHGKSDKSLRTSRGVISQFEHDSLPSVLYSHGICLQRAWVLYIFAWFNVGLGHFL